MDIQDMTAEERVAYFSARAEREQRMAWRAQRALDALTREEGAAQMEALKVVYATRIDGDAMIKEMRDREKAEPIPEPTR